MSYKTIFTPGQTAYLLFWKRPEEDKLTRACIYSSKRHRDNTAVRLMLCGLITKRATMHIPLPEAVEELSESL